MGKKWFSHVLKTAKMSYKKSKRGGADEPNSTSETPAPVTGGRRRTRRHGRR